MARAARVRQRATANADRAREAGDLERQLRNDREEYASLTVQLNAAAASVTERFNSLWEAARQSAVWEVAEASLQQMFS